MLAPRDGSPREQKEATAVPITNVDHLFREGEEFLKKGQLPEAEQKFLEIKLQNPRYPKIDNRLGIIYMEKGEYGRAIEAFERAVREDPTKAARHANLGVAYAQMKKYSLSRQSLKRAIELAPANERYKLLLEEIEKD